MARPAGFGFIRRGDEVVITHRGRTAATLRGSAATAFLEDVERDDPQQVMAGVTGNYRRGNERVARHHPRNR
jgi:antitoxin (DNA-binding transcriptional repressor) of toxin-antitoxin stability system